MLKRLYVDNYRCFVNFELKLEELTLLVGPNGSGKSSVLDVLFALRQQLSGVSKVTDAQLFPSQTLTKWEKRRRQVFEVTADVESNDDLTYRVEVLHEIETHRARIMLESLTAKGKPLFSFRDGRVQLYRDNHSEGPTYHADWSESAMARVSPQRDNQNLSDFLDLMRGVSVCALDPKRFRTESRSEDAVLMPDASNLASWYRHQIQEQPAQMHSVFAALGEVIDGFNSIRMEKVGTEARALMVAFTSQEGQYELKFDELSDGQRALIALYALLHLSGDRYTLFLDEPDNYLALAEIQPWLIALADARDGSTRRQAILCSHHPEILDYFGYEAGVMLTRESSGVTSVRPLKEVITAQEDSGLKLSEIVARGWEL